MWLYLPHLLLSPSPTLTGTGTNLTSVLTELYNSSTSTQSPTRSFKSHVWSSSSGNNCHAVHRSLSSGASVYECTMGIFFTSSHFISQFPPTRFPLLTAIRMCQFLPVHPLFGQRPKYNKSFLFTLINFSKVCYLISIVYWSSSYSVSQWPVEIRVLSQVI